MDAHVHVLGTGVFYCFQSAMKISVSCGFIGFRFEAQTSFRPSGENMGKLSKTLLKVMRSSPVPSMLMRYSSKLCPYCLISSCQSSILLEKMIRLPSGCHEGAKFVAPLCRIIFLFDPSASMTQRSR